MSQVTIWYHIAFVTIFHIVSNPFSPLNNLSLLLYPIIVLNVVLAVFNLIPVHPLDGGKILVGIVPENEADKVDRFLTKYGLFILLFLIFPFGGRSIISYFLTPTLEFILGILT